MNLDAEAGKVYFYEFNIDRESIGSPALKGGGGLPGDPGNTNLSVRDAPTSDTVTFDRLDEDEGRARLSHTPFSQSTGK